MNTWEAKELDKFLKDAGACGTIRLEVCDYAASDEASTLLDVVHFAATNFPWPVAIFLNNLGFQHYFRDETFGDSPDIFTARLMQYGPDIVRWAKLCMSQEASRLRIYAVFLQSMKEDSPRISELVMGAISLKPEPFKRLLEYNGFYRDEEESEILIQILEENPEWQLTTLEFEE